MLGTKFAERFAVVFIAAAFLISIGLCMFSGTAFAGADSGVTMEYESALFDHGQIISVNIIMDEDEWQDMLDNAASEEYYKCDAVINGATFYSVGIRPKGNTSLSSIVNDPTTDRYSFKLEFDKYVDGQTCFGLDKLVLNNNYADATNMKEAIVYDMFAYLGTDSSLYNYAKISVNGEYWGVYLALEAVEDSFLLRNYGVSSGGLYKPDSMQMGGGKGGNDDKSGNGGPGGNGTPPEKPSGDPPSGAPGGEITQPAQPAQPAQPSESGDSSSTSSADDTASGTAGTPSADGDKTPETAGTTETAATGKNAESAADASSDNNSTANGQPGFPGGNANNANNADNAGNAGNGNGGFGGGFPGNPGGSSNSGTSGSSNSGLVPLLISAGAAAAGLLFAALFRRR